MNIGGSSHLASSRYDRRKVGGELRKNFMIRVRSCKISLRVDQRHIWIRMAQRAGRRKIRSSETEQEVARYSRLMKRPVVTAASLPSWTTSSRGKHLTMTQRPSSILVLGILFLFCSCERHEASHSADDTKQSDATNNAKLAELPVEKEVAVYTPRIDDFRKAYDDDLENQEIQTWEEYWDWVQQFYSGTLVLNGWVGSTNQCLAVVTIPDRRRELAKMMNEVGLVVCREWAKDKTVGK